MQAAIAAEARVNVRKKSRAGSNSLRTPNFWNTPIKVRAYGVTNQSTYPQPIINGTGGATLASTPIGIIFRGDGSTFPLAFTYRYSDGTIHFISPTYTIANNAALQTCGSTSRSTPIPCRRSPPRTTSMGIRNMRTSHTVEGFQNTLVVTLDQWRDPGQLAQVLAYAADLLDSVKDTVVEGSVVYYGWYAVALTCGQALQVAGDDGNGSYTTGWESIANLCVVEVEVEWTQRAGYPYRTTMRVSTRRMHYQPDMFLNRRGPSSPSGRPPTRDGDGPAGAGRTTSRASGAGSGPDRHRPRRAATMNEASNLWARIRALVRIVNELKARVAALKTRLAAIEQNGAGRWINRDERRGDHPPARPRCSSSPSGSGPSSGPGRRRPNRRRWPSGMTRPRPGGGDGPLRRLHRRPDRPDGPRLEVWPVPPDLRPGLGHLHRLQGGRLPGRAGAALGAIAVQHVLVNRGTLQTSWKSAGGTSGCPVASACADTRNASFQWLRGRLVLRRSRRSSTRATPRGATPSSATGPTTG